MNARLQDYDLETARIRALQAIYKQAHLALINWGNWAADLRGFKPIQAPPSIWNQFARSKVQEWGEEGEYRTVLVTGRPKAEAPDIEPYDEKKAVILDERIHGAGGLPDYVRLCLRTAYVTREIPDSQFPKLSGCSPDAFCERLESGLRFAKRFT